MWGKAGRWLAAPARDAGGTGDVRRGIGAAGTILRTFCCRSQFQVIASRGAALSPVIGIKARITSDITVAHFKKVLVSDDWQRSMFCVIEIFHQLIGISENYCFRQS
jgi:hypothetical protein